MNIYVGSASSGILKSTDGGESWPPANQGLIDTRILSLEIDPVNTDTIYARTGGGGVFKNTNGGY
jgi:photosystem II stability/assembly factor-like uncharacterized protein